MSCLVFKWRLQAPVVIITNAVPAKGVGIPEEAPENDGSDEPKLWEPIDVVHILDDDEDEDEVAADGALDAEDAPLPLSVGEPPVVAEDALGAAPAEIAVADPAVEVPPTLAEAPDWRLLDRFMALRMCYGSRPPR